VAKGHSIQPLVVALILCAALRVFAQGPDQAAPKTAKIGTITITGAKKFPADQIIAASKLKVGDTVAPEQIQAAADLLAGLGVFSTINYHFAAKGEALAIEFQVQEAPTVPVGFDNFPWFTDDELASAIRQEVGLFNGEAPEGGALLDAISAVLEKLLSSRKITGRVEHQLVAQPVEDGMMMQFHLVGPALRMGSLQFGESLASGSEKVKDRASDLKAQPFSRYAIEIFEHEQIRPLYVSGGHLRAQIGPPQVRIAGKPEEPDSGAVEVVIPIAPGEVYLWNGAQWQGILALPSSALDAAVSIKPGEVADGMRIERGWERAETVYKSNGYLDAKLDAKPQFDDAAHRVSYRVQVNEGAQYRMGDMVVTGLSLDAEKLLRRFWHIAPGQIFDDDYFETVLKTLAKPSAEVFGDRPIHYTECGHWLRPNTDRHTVDVLLDFK
jgi:outer membrane protein insertion porin family